MKVPPAWIEKLNPNDPLVAMGLRFARKDGKEEFLGQSDFERKAHETLGRIDDAYKDEDWVVWRPLLEVVACAIAAHPNTSPAFVNQVNHAYLCWSSCFVWRPAYQLQMLTNHLHGSKVIPQTIFDELRERLINYGKQEADSPFEATWVNIYLNTINQLLQRAGIPDQDNPICEWLLPAGCILGPSHLLTTLCGEFRMISVQDPDLIDCDLWLAIGSAEHLYRNPTGSAEVVQLHG